MKNKSETIETGYAGCLNQNCWLVKNLGYAPYRRCQYCDFKFRNCLFLHYQIVSAILIVLSFSAFLLVEGKLSVLAIISIFVLVIVYGYFFNKSTEKIVQANFAQRKAKETLEKFNEKLKDMVDEQTKDIQDKAEHLGKLLKMRSEFLDIASHQLRTPTSVIKGTLAMMKEGDMEKMSTEEKAHFVEGMFQKSVKLESIINDILVASEMDTADFDIKVDDQIELDQFLEKEVKDHQFDAEEKKIALSFEKLSSGPFKIKGNAKYLEQVVDNLLSNALKYTPQGLIKATIKNDKDSAIIAISDTGIGIPKEDLERIFNKFIRGKNACDAYTDGSGLGLFIIKRVMDRHIGSKVWVESEEGKGSTFYLQFPLIET